MKRILAISAAAAALLTSAAPSSPAGAADVPGTSCTVFPANNVWHLDIRKLPVHPKSATWKRATNAGTTRLHPDFGPPSYGIPFDVVLRRTRKSRSTSATETRAIPVPTRSAATCRSKAAPIATRS